MYQLKTEIYLDKHEKCYKKIIIIDPIPNDPIIKKLAITIKFYISMLYYVKNKTMNFNKNTCYNPYIKNILNKGGIRNNNFIYSKKLLNEKQNMTYDQNSRSAIRNTTDISNNYVVTPDIPSDIKVSTFTVKCQQNVVKYSNRKFNTNLL